jgi:beta-glucosidase
VNFAVRNNGERAGAEIAQVYLEFPQSAGEPPKRLIGWEKINLAPGESKSVTLDIDPLYLSVFDAQANHWKILPGEYKVMAGSSSRDLPLSATVQLRE